MNRSIEKLRLEYGNAPLEESGLANDPVQQFQTWLLEAIHAKVIEPNGMILSTTSHLNHPSSRTVLLKKVDSQGFYFYSNYQSRKGEQLEVHPFAALTFWWKEIYRQINIEGVIKKTKRRDSSLYFHKRPKGAQLAALASDQSRPIASRVVIEESFNRVQKKYRGKEVPCPKDWGGYCLIPDRIEFWQGRKNRLHDRVVYVRAEKEWVISRLAP